MKEKDKSAFVFAQNAKRNQTSHDRPLKVAKSFASIEALRKFGDDLADMIGQALASPGTPIMVDHGRVFINADLEIVIDASALPSKTITGFKITPEGIEEIKAEEDE